MKPLKARAIVLSRVNYGERDRIITVITPNYGKLRLMARGSRVLKSKLAGGIELFSVNDVCFIRGRSEVATLTSARLDKNYGDILKDIERVQYGYELLKILHHATEDETETDFFNLLQTALDGLNDLDVPLAVTQLWFLARLLVVSGHMPDLERGSNAHKLSEQPAYNFDHETMAFFASSRGLYSPNDIKFLRLAFRVREPRILARVNEGGNYSTRLLPLVDAMRLRHLSR